MHAAAGYLLVADWTTARLYDASERWVLRLIEATTFADPLREDGLQTVMFVGSVAWTDGERFVVGDMHSMYFGDIVPGARGPSAVLVDRFWSLRTPGQGRPLRIANGGRRSLYIDFQPDDGLSVAGSSLVVPPLGDKQTRVTFDEVGDWEDWAVVRLNTDDPATPQHIATLWPSGDNFTAGDAPPELRLPAISPCPDGGNCDFEMTCSGPWEAEFDGMPILLAFYAST